MRKILHFIVCLLLVAACDKHDPILPGNRTAVFATDGVNILNTNVPNLPDKPTEIKNADCPYTQDNANVIWNGDKKIFTGFSTSNSVKSTQTPVCYGNYLFAGLTTGELVKINTKTRNVLWVADIYSPSNLTGGAPIVDITAPIILHNNWIYVGGLGDALCCINANTGNKKWCDKIGVGLPVIFMDDVLFVVGTDNYLYAVRTTDGAVYWRTQVKKQYAPEYLNGVIKVGRQKINAATGEIIKK